MTKARGVGQSLSVQWDRLVLAICVGLLGCGGGGASSKPAETPKNTKPAASEQPGEEAPPKEQDLPEEGLTDDKGEAPPVPKPDPNAPVKLAIKIHPGTDITAADAKEIYLSFDVSNTSSKPADTQLSDAVLLVNGKPLKQWRGAMKERPIDERWNSLAPGKQVSFLFQFAKRVKVKPGTYVFVLRAGDFVSEPVELIVRP